MVAPGALLLAYVRSGLTLTAGALPAIGLLAAGAVLSAVIGRVLYQKSLTITDNNNGFVSMFFLLIAAFTCLLALALSPWMREFKFSVGPFLHLKSAYCGAAPCLFLAIPAREDRNEKRQDPPYPQQRFSAVNFPKSVDCPKGDPRVSIRRQRKQA